MKSFLCKNKKPTIKWGMLPDNIFYEGTVPNGYDLAISPSKGYVILDVDRHGKVDGFTNIPLIIRFILLFTFNYKTKNNGKHYWLKYTGSMELANKASNLGIDLRTDKGYVIYYRNDDMRNNMHSIIKSPKIVNRWLEKLFGYVEHK